MKTAALLFPLSLITLSAQAQSVTLGFDNNRTSDFGASSGGTFLSISGTGTSLQAADELVSANFTISGAPLSSAFSFTMTADDSANTGDSIEIDTTGLDVDGGGFDTTETIEFVFSTDIVITEFDFANIDNSTFAGVSIGGVDYTYGDVADDLHTLNIALSKGDSLIFGYAATNGIDYDLQSFTFNVVPEPGAYAMIAGLLGLTSVMLRRRR